MEVHVYREVGGGRKEGREMRCFVHIVSEGGRWREGGRPGREREGVAT